jgi:hypothetical protein
MAEIPEQATDIEELFPPDPDAELTPDEELDISENALDNLDSEDDVEVIIPEKAPLGRAWAYNFQEETMMVGHSAPAIRGNANLIHWIEKCLRTEAGSSVVHPPGYGLEKSLGDYLALGLSSTGDLSRAIVEAVTFHPSIQRVEDIEVVSGTTLGNDAAVSISFRVVLGDGSDLEFDTEISTGEVELG